MLAFSLCHIILSSNWLRIWDTNVKCFSGREDEAFYFLKFWTGPHAGRGAVNKPTGKELDRDTFGRLSEGDWFR